MQTRRNSLMTLSLGGWIYAVGGQFKNIGLSTVERSDLNSLRKREFYCFCLRNCNMCRTVQIVFCFCLILLSISHYRYSIKDDTWITLAPMLTERRSTAIATLSNKIFVMGGRRIIDEILNSVECYDPIKDEWSNVAPMNEKRITAQAGVINGQIFVVGGWNGSQQLSNIERYDQLENKWTIVIIF